MKLKAFNHGSLTHSEIEVEMSQSRLLGIPCHEFYERFEKFKAFKRRQIWENYGSIALRVCGCSPMRFEISTNGL